MGCDIHIILERKVEDRDEWYGLIDFGSLPRREAYNNLHEGVSPYLWHRLRIRNYEFFGQLASVRRAGPEGPRGVPKNASLMTCEAINSWGVDGHSHSWHTAVEFLHKWCTANELDPIKLVSLFHEFTGQESYGSLDEYRFVFWFDN